MEFLYGLDDKAVFRNNKLVSELPKKNISVLFSQSRMFGETQDLHDNCLQIGWNTLCVFQENDAGLRLVTSIYENAISGTCQGQTFTQVTTRAVSTCTVAHVTVGNIHIFAHLDMQFLDEGYKYIEQQVTAAKNKFKEVNVIGFCSHINNDEENRFSNNLRELCNRNYEELLRHRGDGINWDNLEPCDLFGHFEIGLSRENGNVVLFGDITDLSGSGFEAPTMRFRNQMELFGAKEELSRNRLEND